MAESEQQNRKVILTALKQVRDECGHIEKDGFNAFHKYSYVSEAALANALRPLLGKHGLVIIPSVALDPAPHIDELGVTHMVMEFTIAHESGAVWPEKIRVFASGSDRDSKGLHGDKGAYKANTGGYKYFLNRLFMVDTGDDPERSGAAKSKAKPPKPRPEREGRPPSDSDISKDATPQQLKMLGAKAGAQAGKLLEMADGEGMRLDKLYPNKTAVVDEIKRLARERVGCGEKIARGEVNPLIVAIESAGLNIEGVVTLYPSAATG